MRLSVPAFSQGFSVGVKAGVPITEYFSAGFRSQAPFNSGIQYSSATRRYTLGIAAEWRSAHRIGIEADLEYKRAGYIHNGSDMFPPLSGLFGTSVYAVRGSSWDIPILMKYRFRQPMGLFVSGGSTFRHLGPVRAQGTRVLTDILGHTNTVNIDTSQPEELTSRNFWGATVGAGFEFGESWLHFLPELRYTRWISNIDTTDGALRFEPNQVELFLGLLIHPR